MHHLSRSIPYPPLSFTLILKSLDPQKVPLFGKEGLKG